MLASIIPVRSEDKGEEKGKMLETINEKMNNVYGKTSKQIRRERIYLPNKTLKRDGQSKSDISGELRGNNSCKAETTPTSQ